MAGLQTIFTYAKPPLNEVEKDLNENIPPTCIIPTVSVSTNESQTSQAFTENSAPIVAKLAPFAAKTSFMIYLSQATRFSTVKI